MKIKLYLDEKHWQRISFLLSDILALNQSQIEGRIDMFREREKDNKKTGI